MKDWLYVRYLIVPRATNLEITNVVDMSTLFGLVVEGTNWNYQGMSFRGRG